MSAPTEQRPEDVMQAALVALDQEYQQVHGLPQTWSVAVIGSYAIDAHFARMRATNWGEAA